MASRATNRGRKTYYTDTKTSTEEIDFSHFLVDSSEGSVIGFERSNGSVYKLLISAGSGWVKIRSLDQWLELPEKDAERIRRKAEESFGRRPVYRLPRCIT